MTIKSILSLIVISLTFLPLPSYADQYGQVVGVSDGDTITLLTPDRTQVKVRLAGIDAPEKKQDFGDRSKQSLSDCAYGKQASIEGDKMDRYGRTIGKVIVNGTDCNLRQIQLGMAWHYKQYQREQSPEDRTSYADAENQARSSKIGLWSMSYPVAPWEFRRAR